MIGTSAYVACAPARQLRPEGCAMEDPAAAIRIQQVSNGWRAGRVCTMEDRETPPFDLKEKKHILPRDPVVPSQVR